MSRTAIDIYQTFLDETSALVWTGQIRALSARFVYPNTVRTMNVETRVESREEMERMVDAFRANMKQLGATAYHRICTDAVMAADGQSIQGGHTSYLLRGAATVVEPYKADSSYVLRDGVWMGAGITCRVRNADVQINAPHRTGLP
ncbi:MAG: hypothetical protein AAFY65_16300 [Pseudomonadota bacterium]